ncbi:YfjI family protein [Bartonella sp. 220]|uniref:YfjI family protein n=1 Tax=Bartonella sp. 220B TaxID=2967260 RepID=UPI0022A97FD9|nr:YfjI family protein [Bartonella sp. 220B]MCZ2159191.1 YfjI family protein [Bartonella sp. 220B]
MKQDVQNNNENIPLNNNDNDHNNDTVSLKEHPCLQAIPYEQALQQIGWGELKPISSALLPVVPFHPAQVPTALGNYIYDIADRQQSPVDFVAVSALCGLAALIGNGVRIAPKQHSNDWKIVPNLWGMIIGQPSARKTPAMQAALAPLYVFQNEWYQEWRQQKKQQETKDILMELDKREKKKQAGKALKNKDKKQALVLLAEPFEHKESEDDTLVKRRLIVNDVTVEKLGELLKENPRGLLMVRDELSGFLANLELKEYQTDRGFYLQAFNGDQPYTYDRIGRGTIHIPNATLSIIGGIQPSRIIPLIQAIKRGINDDGFLQRFQMIVWPDENQDRKWVDRYRNQEAREAYKQVFRSLYDKPVGSSQYPITMHFSAEAQEIFREWWENHQKEIRRDDLSESLQSHLGKMDKTIASLALIFELIEGGRFEINKGALQTALRWEEYLLSHAKRLYAAGDTLTEERAKLIVERCDGLPEVFTARDIYRRCWAHLKDKEAVKQALELLCHTNHIRELFHAGSGTGRPPDKRYEWHPLVKNQSIKQ